MYRHLPQTVAKILIIAFTIAAVGCGFDAIEGDESLSSAELRGGKGGGKKKFSVCTVTPNPAVMGEAYTVSAIGLSGAWTLRVDIEDTDALRSFAASADADGRIEVSATSASAGPATATVYRLHRDREQVKATCNFEVVVPCTPTTCAATGTSCGLIDDGCGGTLDCGVCPPVCGDGSCDPEEDCASCEVDCGACPPPCGDGLCEEGEDCSSCEADCGDCPPVCGDGSCDAGEDCASCAADCGTCPPVCGDGSCDTGEDCVSCAADCDVCPPVCGDGTCDVGEDCASCAADCGACPPVCGDGTCDAGEDCVSCAADCDACPPVCGDGTCDVGEDCASCEADCGVCGGTCGDNVCDGNGGEMCTSCAADCDTSSPVCGNGACEAGEDSDSCYGDCGPTPWPNSWEQWEEEVVALINVERAAGTDCASGPKEPRGPLSMNANLQRAAQLHSWDMSYSSYFSHTSCNGRSPWQRAADQGSNASGECIGGGYSSPASMVNGWMNSSGHCNILMGGYSQVGIGFAQAGGKKWTAMFR